MYCAVTFVVFGLAALAAADDNMRKCHKVHPGMMHCCNGISMNPEINPREQIKECFAEHPRHHPLPHPPSCDLDECIAKKLGYYEEGGSINKEALASMVEKAFENNEDFVTVLKDKCVNADLSKQGPPDMCVFMKVKHCLHNQFLKNCPEWSDEGECSGIKDIVPDCIRDD